MPKAKHEEPKLIEGAISVDDRGTVSFVNDFDFSGVKRSYIVTNHKSGFVRAWHAHKKEAKYVTVVRGSAIIGAVKIDDWKKPSKETPVSRYVLSDKKPSVLYIPAGYANGFMSLTRDTILAFYSTATIDQSRGDDTRFAARYWDIWQIIER